MTPEPSSQQPVITSADGSRSFPCFPAAVIVLVVDEREQLLAGYHNTRQRWEAVSGVLEPGEVLVDAALRELREEMGAAVRARPLGVLHASTFRYDDNARFMLSVTFLMAYEGGTIEPGDDMSDGGHRWFALDDLVSGSECIAIPRERWVLRRAREQFRVWRHESVELQTAPGERG